MKVGVRPATSENRLKPLRRIPIDLTVLLGEGNTDEACASARALHTATTRRIVQRPMNRADDEAFVHVPELTRLPVHLHRHMRATVEVGHGDRIKPNGKRRCNPPSLQHIEQHSLTTFLQIGRSTQPLRCQREFRHVATTSDASHRLNEPQTGRDSHQRPLAHARRS